VTLDKPRERLYGDRTDEACFSQEKSYSSESSARFRTGDSDNSACEEFFVSVGACEEFSHSDFGNFVPKPFSQSISSRETARRKGADKPHKKNA
jgi:hypothetical protein